jgi:hypothetical protein
MGRGKYASLGSLVRNASTSSALYYYSEFQRIHNHNVIDKQINRT